MTAILEGRCHCGAIAITLSAPPTQIFQCNCSLCAKTGWMGAYDHPDAIGIVGAENCTGYVQGDRTITVWHCRTCGIPTHWTPLTAPPDRMGVNIRLFAPEQWSDIPVHHNDGRSY